MSPTDLIRYRVDTFRPDGSGYTANLDAYLQPTTAKLHRWGKYLTWEQAQEVVRAVQAFGVPAWRLMAEGAIDSFEVRWYECDPATGLRPGRTAHEDGWFELPLRGYSVLFEDGRPVQVSVAKGIHFDRETVRRELVKIGCKVGGVLGGELHAWDDDGEGGAVAPLVPLQSEVAP